MLIRNLVFALAVSLSIAPSAFADVPQNQQRPAASQNVDEAFHDWVAPIVSALDRANAAAAPFMQMDIAVPEGDVAAATALLQEMSRQSQAARAGLASVRAELAAIQPFAHRNADADFLNMAQIMLRDSRGSVDNMDRMLANMVELVAAYERGDALEFQRLQVELEQSVRIMVQAQATSLRARQRLVPSTSSQHHALAGMAAMYDGMAQLFENDESLSIAALNSAADRMSTSLVAERAAIVVERATILRNDRHYAVLTQIMDARAEGANINQRARDILRTAAQEATAGRSTIDIRLDHVGTLGAIEYEYQAVIRRQFELVNQLSQ